MLLVDVSFDTVIFLIGEYNLIESNPIQFPCHFGPLTPIPWPLWPVCLLRLSFHNKLLWTRGLFIRILKAAPWGLRQKSPEV